MRTQFIRIGSRILNLESIQFIEIDGPDLLRVFLAPNQFQIEYLDEEARALLAILNSGHVRRMLTETETSAQASSPQ